MRPTSISLQLLVVLFGCPAEPGPAPFPDAALAIPDVPQGEPPQALVRVVAVEALDANERAWPLMGTPWHPTLDVELSEAPGEIVPLLFEGASVGEIREDLSRPPLRIANRARLVDVDFVAGPRGIRVNPVEALEPGPHILALEGDGLSGTPWVVAFHVAESGGAALRDTWPPSEASAVPAGIPQLYARFDDEVAGELLVRGPGGAIDVERAHVPCDFVGWPDGFCVSLTLNGTLRSGGRYTFDARALRDRFGQTLSQRSSFHTVSESTTPGALHVECVLDETPIDFGCVLADDESITLRTRFDAPVLARLDVGASAYFRAAPRGEIEIRVAGLQPATDRIATLHIFDFLGRAQNFDAAFVTTRTLPPVYITEVRSNPVGPEPAQEYVELYNAGDASVRLEGWTLSDHGQREGDLLSGAIPGHGRVLVVADDFESSAGTTPQGTLLIRVGRSIGSGGLSNGGENLYLRTEDGLRVAFFPARAAALEGECWRASEAGRRPDVEAGPCRPGRE